MHVNAAEDIYDGEFVYGKRHGIGNLKTTKDSFFITFIGEFKSNLYHGKGQITIQDKNKIERSFSTDDLFVYNGNFMNGKRHGQGEMYWCQIN